jgi:hypothetical protein
MHDADMLPRASFAKELLKLGCDPNYVEPTMGRSLLLLAMENGAADAASILLAAVSVDSMKNSSANRM